MCSSDLVELIETAINEMFRMDIQKREALYYLGNAYEALNNREKALDAYNKISANMKNYRDIQERIAALTGSENQTSE